MSRFAPKLVVKSKWYWCKKAIAAIWFLVVIVAPCVFAWDAVVFIVEAALIIAALFGVGVLTTWAISEVYSMSKELKKFGIKSS